MSSPVTGFALVATVQLVPSQCSTTVWYKTEAPAVGWYCPTAQTSEALSANTLWRMLSPNPGLGLTTLTHELPFQCSTIVTSWDPLTSKPTAHTLLLATADTPVRNCPRVLGEGVVTAAQALPFQC